MAFFSDLFKGITGQSAAPNRTNLDIGSLYNQGAGIASGADIAFNNALQPAYTQNKLNAEKKYDPNAPTLRQETTQAFLNNLRLGNEIPSDVRDQVVRNSLQNNAASGFGLTPGGRGLTARDLGLTSLDIGNQRRQQAAQFGLANSQIGLNLYNPITTETPGSVASALAGEQQAQDQNRIDQENNRIGNFGNIIKTGLSAIGTIAGGFFGGGALEAIGGPAAGIGGGSNGGGIFQSILNGISGSGGRFSSGTGRLYGDNPSNTEASLRATGVNLAGF